jgi:hypothetical protein
LGKKKTQQLQEKPKLWEYDTETLCKLIEGEQKSSPKNLTSELIDNKNLFSGKKTKRKQKKANKKSQLAEQELVLT